MAKLTKPRAGSLAYSPRKRHKKRPYPSIGSWQCKRVEGTKPMAFAGYKAGMTYVMALDKHEGSPSFQQTVSVPVTIIECPPVVVFCIRAYRLTAYGMEPMTEVWMEGKPEKELGRKLATMPKKKAEKKEVDVGEIEEVRLVVHTRPTKKKKPEVFEIKVNGGPKEAWEYANSVLGKELDVKDVLAEGDYVDVLAVTKGKGTQGPVKRFGIGIQIRKAKGHRRHVGALGPWTPSKTTWRVPQAGQTGYHKRTEVNKRVLKVSDNADEVKIEGGIPGYGEVRNPYVLLSGSVPGHRKRVVLLRFAVRPPSKQPELPEITKISVRSQQG